MFASPYPYGGFQSPGLSVGGTNGRAQAIPNYMVFKGHSNNLTFCDSVVLIIITKILCTSEVITTSSEESFRNRILVSDVYYRLKNKFYRKMGC